MQPQQEKLTLKRQPICYLEPNFDTVFTQN